jgi:anti-anti-sigma regulatory factor
MDEAGNPVDVVVDVSCVQQMTTAAFAQLVAMNSSLRLRGGCMRTEGLQGQPRGLCEILGLVGVLLDSRDNACEQAPESGSREPAWMPHAVPAEPPGCGAHAASDALKPPVCT